MREIAFEFVSSSQQKMSNFSSFHLLITFKDDTFKEDSGKLWVEVFVVTYLDAVTSSNRRPHSKRTRSAVHYALLLNRHLVE